MKKTILSVSLFVLAGASAMFITSCSKDDTAPIITITGDDPATVSLNGTYTDLGATANDDKDGDVTANITMTSDVNEDLAGTYTVTYTVSDKEGNTASESRTVNVVNDADYLVGTYGVVETDPLGATTAFTQSISTSTTVNNRIIFSKFADYTNNNEIYVNISGTTLTMPNQQGTGIGSNGCNHSFTQLSGGIGLSQLTGKWAFSLKFNDTSINTGGSCTSTSSVNYTDSFLQQ